MGACAVEAISHPKKKKLRSHIKNSKPRIEGLLNMQTVHAYCA